MKQAKANIGYGSVMNATHRALQWRDDAIERGIKLQTDPDKAERLDKCECVTCFYFGSRIGGASCTERPCGLCEKPMHFGNTCTDVICKDCAKQHNLCKHCGADIKLRQRRKFELETKE